MENIVRKGEVACNKQFLLFLSMFSTLYGTYFSFQIYFHMSSVICFSLDQPKILSSGNGLNSEQRRFQPYFSYIAATSAPVHAFLEVFFFFSELRIIFFLCHITIVETIDSGERRMNPDATSTCHRISSRGDNS